MGAQCSSTARSRFESIKNLVMRKACLTSYTADGLLPRGNHGPLIWIFGEDHSTNEAVKHAGEVRELSDDDKERVRGKNCLLLLDVAIEAASDCSSGSEAKADVIFLYENAVIAESEMFRMTDPNEWQLPNSNLTGMIATRHALKPMITTSEMSGSRPGINASPNRPDPNLPPSLDTMPKSFDELGRLRLANDNLKAVPMDVFHRMRSFNHSPGDRVKGPFTPFIAVDELRLFWQSVGYYTNDLQYIFSEFQKLAQEQHAYVALQGFREDTQASVYEALVCVSLTKLAFERNAPVQETIEERDFGWHIGKKKAIDELDTYVDALLQESSEYSPSLRVPSREFFDSNVAGSMGLRNPTDQDYREFVVDQLAFEIIGLCGDMIVYEYISGMVLSKQNSTIVLMNAGFAHTNRIQSWLVAGQYDLVHQRVSDDARADQEFMDIRRV